MPAPAPVTAEPQRLAVVDLGAHAKRPAGSALPLPGVRWKAV